MSLFPGAMPCVRLVASASFSPRSATVISNFFSKACLTPSCVSPFLTLPIENKETPKDTYVSASLLPPQVAFLSPFYYVWTIVLIALWKMKVHSSLCGWENFPSDKPPLPSEWVTAYYDPPFLSRRKEHDFPFFSAVDQPFPLLFSFWGFRFFP